MSVFPQLSSQYVMYICSFPSQPCDKDSNDCETCCNEGDVRDCIFAVIISM